MMSNKTTVKITSRGMITLPLGIRKKFHFHEGTIVTLLEDEGRLVIVPIIDISTQSEFLPSCAEIAIEIERDNAEELELEK